MATPSATRGPAAGARPRDRRLERRQQTIEEALVHAVAIMGETGVGSVSMSEIARRMGMQGPSLYKYFSSLHAVFDALFARGLAAHNEAMFEAMATAAPGVPRVRAMSRASVQWSVHNSALAQLLFWRPVPGFEPSPSTYATSVHALARIRAELAEAVRRKELGRRAKGDDALRLLTVVLSGLFTRQAANEPGASFDAGMISRLTDEAIDMFLAHYPTPERF